MNSNEKNEDTNEELISSLSEKEKELLQKKLSSFPLVRPWIPKDDSSIEKRMKVDGSFDSVVIPKKDK